MLTAISLSPKSGHPPNGLIVILHGWGANAQDVAFLCSLLDLPTLQFMLPNAPFPHPYSEGRMWYGLPETIDARTDVSQQQDLLTSRQQLTDWLNSLQTTTGVPLSRTILGGFSQGGAMTLDVGLSLPLAGLMVLSGYQHTPFVQHASYPPILLVHGRQDQVVPIAAAHRARANLANLNAAVEYQEFDMGHEISPLVLKEMQRFIQKLLNA